MKAPEKLYYIGDDSLVLDPFPVLYLLSTEKYDNEVEYIRKDAFIEKACDAYCKVCKVPNCRSNECKWISNYKRHLEEIIKEIGL